MNVVSNFTHNYDEDPVRFFDFESLSNIINSEYLLFYGDPPSDKIFQESKLKKILFTLEEQYSEEVGFIDPGEVYKYENYVDKILTITPTYIHNLKKRKYVFFPFNEKYIPSNKEKKYDICYTGFANVKFMNELLTEFVNYNYAFVSFKEIIGVKNYFQNPKKYLRKKLFPKKYNFPNLLINLPNLSYKNKLEIISESKVSLVHNQLNNGAPQLKSRTFESAFCKSLILVKKDKFNIIEDWFEEEKHFVYFENKNDFKEKLNYILKNYSEFAYKIQNAYLHALENYTTQKFVQKYLS
jgi:hypothetical protein